MKISNPFNVAVVHIVCFIFGYALMHFAFSHSDSRNAYSLISAWWFSLYVGMIVGANLRCLIFALPMAAIGLTALYLIGAGSSFYHHAPTTLSSKLAFVVFVQSVVIVSPILINSGLGFVTRRFHLISKH